MVVVHNILAAPLAVVGYKEVRARGCCHVLLDNSKVSGDRLKKDLKPLVRL